MATATATSRAAGASASLSACSSTTARLQWGRALLRRPSCAPAFQARAPQGRLARPWGNSVVARAQEPSGSPGDEERERLAEVDAMQEAIELYKEAQDMSQRQVLQELMQMEIADMAHYDDGTVREGPPPVLQQQHPGSIRRVPAAAAASASAVSPLQSFWVEQGLEGHVAYGIAKDMVEAQSRFCDLTQLAVQVQRLGRIIPGRVQDMVARDWHILESTPNTVAQHYVQLVQLFPNNLDVSELACKQPKLLYCEDLVGQFEAVVAKLVQLHPSHNPEEARALLIENPELIFRMRYYMHTRTLDELPIELQNMFVYTGQGLHHLHQMYSDSISPRFL